MFSYFGLASLLILLVLLASLWLYNTNLTLAMVRSRKLSSLSGATAVTDVSKPDEDVPDLPDVHVEHEVHDAPEGGQLVRPSLTDLSKMSAILLPVRNNKTSSQEHGKTTTLKSIDWSDDQNGSSKYPLIDPLNCSFSLIVKCVVDWPVWD